MATGYYHKYNYLKYRILFALKKLGGTGTAQEIANVLHLDRKRITDELYHWYAKDFGYVQRLPGKNDGIKAYRYKITNKGLETFNFYHPQIKNLTLPHTQKNIRVGSVVGFFGISQAGVEMGIEPDEFAAFLKQTQTDNDVKFLSHTY